MDTLQFSKLSGVEKAAVLLLSLGEQATAKIFEQLDDVEIRKISRAMMNISHVPVEVAQQVMDHFDKAKAGNAGIFVRGEEFVKRAIAGSSDDDRKAALLEQISSGASFRPLETIAMMEPRMVAGILEREHPQTVALILSTQTPEHTSKIIDFLPDDFKANIMYRIARIDKVSPEVINQIEESLRREIGLVTGADKQQVGGIEKVVDILTRMSKGKDRTILEQLDETDPEMADAIRKKMFTFEDLIFIDNRGLQAILREVNNDTLVLALKTASDELKEKIFSNISKRAAEMIRDDLEVMGPVRLVEVETAQQEILQVALRLEAESKVVIPGRGGSADELV